MERYINVNDITLKGVAVFDENLDLLIPLSDVRKALQLAPTADVVPRGEVDKWYHEYHAIKDELKQEKMYHRETEKLADKYFNELQTAKSEVAREIFEELDQYIEQNGFGKFYKEYINDIVSELKKKYTEE